MLSGNSHISDSSGRVPCDENELAGLIHGGPRAFCLSAAVTSSHVQSVPANPNKYREASVTTTAIAHEVQQCEKQKTERILKCDDHFQFATRHASPAESAGDVRLTSASWARVSSWRPSRMTPSTDLCSHCNTVSWAVRCFSSTT